MRLQKIILVAAPLVLLGAGAALTGSTLLRHHERKRAGNPDMPLVSCYHCHFVSTDKLAWAQPRPHHDAPGGIVVSPDGKKLFIALDDKDEVAEADVASLTVTRRAKVPGGPFGLALDATGGRLFTTCRQHDRVVVLDTRDLSEQASIEVGMGPTDIAWCQTPSGERLIVPNSGSDDISVLSVTPLRELFRPAAGRDPYAVAVSGDGARVYIANRVAVHDGVVGQPASEVTVLDPANGHVVDRE
jgi:DNA-binding beta-propeller fold protein YncE